MARVHRVLEPQLADLVDEIVLGHRLVGDRDDDRVVDRPFGEIPGRHREVGELGEELLP